MIRIFHHMVACEACYVHNNIVIYLERRKTVPEELHTCIRHATRFLIVRIYATSHDATKIKFNLTFKNIPFESRDSRFWLMPHSLRFKLYL